MTFHGFDVKRPVGGVHWHGSHHAPNWRLQLRRVLSCATIQRLKMEFGWWLISKYCLIFCLNQIKQNLYWNLYRKHVYYFSHVLLRSAMIIIVIHQWNVPFKEVRTWKAVDAPLKSWIFWSLTSQKLTFSGVKCTQQTADQAAENEKRYVFFTSQPGVLAFGCWGNMHTKLPKSEKTHHFLKEKWTF